MISLSKTLDIGQLNLIKLNGLITLFSLREPISKRVINNGLTGSSWHFHRFFNINVKILNVADQLFR